MIQETRDLVVNEICETTAQRLAVLRGCLKFEADLRPMWIDCGATGRASQAAYKRGLVAAAKDLDGKDGYVLTPLGRAVVAFYDHLAARDWDLEPRLVRPWAREWAAALPDDAHLAACEIKRPPCPSGLPATRRATENMGDGSWNVSLCQPCFDHFGLQRDGDELPAAEI